MAKFIPSFQTTNKITNLVADITELVVAMSFIHKNCLNPHLRKINHIKTIHSSLAIEQNTLSLEQVTAIINGK